MMNKFSHEKIGKYHESNFFNSMIFYQIFDKISFLVRKFESWNICITVILLT